MPADDWYRTFAGWVVSAGAFAAPGWVFDPGGVVARVASFFVRAMDLAPAAPGLI